MTTPLDQPLDELIGVWQRGAGREPDAIRADIALAWAALIAIIGSEIGGRKLDPHRRSIPV